MLAGRLLVLLFPSLLRFLSPFGNLQFRFHRLPEPRRLRGLRLVPVRGPFLVAALFLPNSTLLALPRLFFVSVLSTLLAFLVRAATLRASEMGRAPRNVFLQNLSAGAAVHGLELPDARRNPRVAARFEAPKCLRTPLVGARLLFLLLLFLLLRRPLVLVRHENCVSFFLFLFWRVCLFEPY